MRLSSTYHPIELLLKKSKSLLPGVDNVDLIYRNEKRELIGIINDRKVILSHEQLVNWQSKRQKIIQPHWVQKDDFYQFKAINRQLKLEDEDLITSLILPFESEIDGLNDLIIIHFHNRIGLKSFDKAFKNLTTDEKALISSLFFNSLQSDFHAAKEDKRSFEQIKLHYLKIQEENDRIAVRLNETKALYKRSLMHLTYSITDDLEKEHDCKIKISDGAIGKIIIHQPSLTELTSVITNAFYIAFNLSMGDSLIKIHESHIEMDKSETKAKQSSKYIGDKIIALLDRYEVAAERAFENGLPVNGKNVASHLTPAVSPPAITDALKKNNKKIGILLEQFPSKWKRIRHHLKPLQIHQEKIEYRMRSTG
jgi:hypothetical protein